MSVLRWQSESGYMQCLLSGCISKGKSRMEVRLSCLRMNKTWKGWLISSPPVSIPLLMSHFYLLSFNKKVLNTFLGFFCHHFLFLHPCYLKINSEVLMFFLLSKRTKATNYVITVDSLVCMGLNIHYIRKNPNWLLPFVVDPWFILLQRRTKFHKLIGVYIYIWKCMSKGFMEFYKVEWEMAYPHLWAQSTVRTS